MAGTQDNGSWLSPQNPSKLSFWQDATGGDGFDAVWNANNANQLIVSLYYNYLYLSKDKGKTWGFISESLTDVGENNAPFITQIGYSIADPDKIYLVGKSGVSISKNFGQNWQLTPIPSDSWEWTGLGHVCPSLANPEVVWAASRMSASGRMHLSINGGQTFNPTNIFDEALGSLSGLATHPINENTAYSLFSMAGKAKILRTTNKGNSWEDIS